MRATEGNIGSLFSFSMYSTSIPEMYDDWEFLLNLGERAENCHCIVWDSYKLIEYESLIGMIIY